MTAPDSQPWHLVFVTPDTGISLPTRPALLLRELVASGQFGQVTVVRRLRPPAFVGLARALRQWPRRWLALDSTIDDGARVVSHPWPFGPLEERALLALVKGLLIRSPLVLWVSDPKSARVFRSLQTDDRDPQLISVFDAYDAWDKSPLVVGKRRRRAVVEGYRAAASRARLIFGNTTEMVNRFRELGAPDVRYLPNAAPTIRSIEPAREPYLVYVGRVHERFDAQLVTATADRLPGVPIVIAGTVEREPVGWSKLIARPNVRLEGLVPYERARELIGRSRGLLVPHRADDYTRSQDAMKAWDAMSVGAPVLSTSVPPSDRWREPLALLADEPAAFAAAAARLVAGELDHGREARLRLAAENGWSSRAESAIGAIREVSGWG